MQFVSPRDWKDVIFSFVFAGLLAGCGSSDVDRYKVSGTVTYKGEPVKAGQVIFESDPAEENTGPQSYARIKNGVFQTRSIGGPVIVRIVPCDGNASPALPFGNPILKTACETRIELSFESSKQGFVVPKQEEVTTQTTDLEVELIDGLPVS